MQKSRFDSSVQINQFSYNRSQNQRQKHRRQRLQLNHGNHTNGNGAHTKYHHQWFLKSCGNFISQQRTRIGSHQYTATIQYYPSWNHAIAPFSAFPAKNSVFPFPHAHKNNRTTGSLSHCFPFPVVCFIIFLFQFRFLSKDVAF